MRTFFAFVIGVALVLSTPGIAGAQSYPRTASQQQAVDDVIERALSQRGVPFSYGGGNTAGPSRGTGPADNAAGIDTEGNVVGLDPAADVVGFDASGLIVYAFAGVGVKMPRSSGAQYEVGQKVTPAEALPGDLIFYGPDGTQSVALFVGNGQMVEATDPGVAVTPVRTNGMAPYLVRIIR